jgi:hypothetical protein
VGAFFGFLVFLGALTSAAHGMKVAKVDSWSLSKILFNFMASGTLMGFALQRTLEGAVIGSFIGLIATSLIMRRHKMRRHKLK